LSWHRYQGRALAGAALTGEARDTELEAYIRFARSDLCDVRLESAAETDEHEGARRWYEVTYLADDGDGGA
jgi:hypothetical protein